MVANGDIRWITVLVEDYGGQFADRDDAAAWAGAYEHSEIPVLADTDQQLADWLQIRAFPTLVLLDGGLVVAQHSPNGGYDAVLTTLSRGDLP